MKNDERMAWKRHPLPWSQIPDGDVVDANGHFVQFDELVNGQLAFIVAAVNAAPRPDIQ